jgi:uncharacterized LabA/DUF88 family protein
MTKTMIFVDYWNFQLSMSNRANENIFLKWELLPKWFITKAQELFDTRLTFQGIKLYLSFSPADTGLKKWANKIDGFPGFGVIAKERRPAKFPRCPKCYQFVDTCPHCSGSMTSTIEKGVDTALVTDLLGLAWEHAWKVAILITSDRDFIPAVEMVQRKGYRVINGFFPPAGAELARTCWASFDLSPVIDELRLARSTSNSQTQEQM